MIKKLVFIFASFIIFHSRGDAQSTFNDISGVSIGYSQLGPSEAYTINAEYYKIFRAMVLSLTKEVAALTVKVQFLTNENQKLEKTLLHD